MKLRMKLYDSVLNKESINTLNKKGFDYYSSCFINDLKQIDNQYIYAQISALSYIFRILSFCIVLACYSWIIFVLAVIVLITVFIISYVINSRINSFAEEKMKAEEKYLHEYKNNIMGFNEFVYSNNRKLLKEKLFQCNEDLENNDLNLQKKIVKFSSINTIIKSTGFIFIILLSVLLSINNVLKIGTLLATFELVSMLTSDTGSLSNCFQSMIAATPIVNKCLDILNISKRNEICSYYNLKKKIIFEKVNIFIENKKICDNLNFEFDEGKKYLLTGMSGSGKSTIINILMGINYEYTGNIFIDGMTLNAFLNNNRLNVAYIDQNQFIFNDTIRNNITLGRNINVNKINDIIDITKVTEIIKRLPNGLDYVLESNGENVSGGERQRIILARTLLSDSKFYVFDESFSEVDNYSLEILENYLLKMKDITLIYITHKNKNLEVYDKIYYVNDSGEKND